MEICTVTTTPYWKRVHSRLVMSAQNGDCDDVLSQMYPNAAEVCDGLDNDCDGLTDDQDGSLQNPPTWYLDADGDGYGLDTVTMQACIAAPSFISQGGDCDDLNGAISPDGIEVCDLADNNCDGQIDEGVRTDVLL